MAVGHKQRLCRQLIQIVEDKTASVDQRLQAAAELSKYLGDSSKPSRTKRKPKTSLLGE